MDYLPKILPPKKGYATLYVYNESDINFIEETIEKMDEYEYDYLPENFIQLYGTNQTPCYTHKFDSLNLNLLFLILFQNKINYLYIEYTSSYFDGDDS